MTRILMPAPRGCMTTEFGSDARNESWIHRQLCGLATFTWEKGCWPTWLRSNTSRPDEVHRAQRKSSSSSKWKTPSQLDVTAALRELTRVNTGFEMMPPCKKAFQELKHAISDKALLVPYVPHLDIKLYVDHRPMGIPLTLAQKHTDHRQPRWQEDFFWNIGFGSKFLWQNHDVFRAKKCLRECERLIFDNFFVSIIL